MGGFREFKKSMKDAGRSIRSKTNYETGQKELFPAKNWNRSFARDLQERTEGERLDKNIRDTIYGPSGPLTRPALIACMAPTTLFCPVEEPAFMVRGRCSDLQEFYDRPKVKTVIELTERCFLAGWQDYTNEYGVSYEWWQKQGSLAHSIRTETAGTVQDFEAFFADSEASPKVSAHNTSATGQNSLPASKSAKPDRGKNDQSEVPVGPPEAVSSNQTTLKVDKEPPGAAGRSQTMQLAGSPCLDSPNFDASEYFGV